MIIPLQLSLVLFLVRADQALILTQGIFTPLTEKSAHSVQYFPGQGKQERSPYVLDQIQHFDTNTRENEFQVEKHRNNHLLIIKILFSHDYKIIVSLFHNANHVIVRLFSHNYVILY